MSSGDGEATCSRGPFALKDISTLAPSELSGFVTALAGREPWALAIIEARASDGPFDRLASYWAVSSTGVRSSIAVGLLLYFERTNVAADASPIGIEDALAFCVTMFPELDVDVSKRFFTHLTRWLREGNDSQKVLASAALASVPALEALQILEAEAADRGYAQWIMPALLERRIRCDPFNLFYRSERWLEAAISQPRTMVALQSGLERMLEAETLKAVRILQAVVEQFGGRIAAEIRKQIEELGIDHWKSLETLLQAQEPAGDEREIENPEILRTLDDIRKASIGNDAHDDVTATWRTLLRRMAATPAGLQAKWHYVRSFAREWASSFADDGLLASLRPALVGDPEDRPDDSISMLREIQRDFYESRAEHHRDAEQGRRIITDKMSTLVRTRSGKHHPSVLRIPTVIYAEEAYMEVLRMMLRAHFPRMAIEEVHNIPWDGLDEALAAGDCDLGLNNDGILANFSGSKRPELYRLDGPPIYKVDHFQLLARASFLKKAGVSIPPSIAASRRTGFVFEGKALEKMAPVLVSLLADGGVSVPRGTLLETRMRDIVGSLDGPLDNIFDQASDDGLSDFLSGDVPMYLGGSLQTSYALRAWDDAVQLCEFRTPMEGRLFCSATLAVEHPQFMKDVANISARIRNAFIGDPSVKYNDALKFELVHHMNVTLLESAEKNVTAVADFAQLEHALLHSKLQACGMDERKWCKWGTQEDSTSAERARATVAKLGVLQ